MFYYYEIEGHDGRAEYGNCTSSLNNKVDSILQWAYKQGKSVGIVSTTRITHVMKQFKIYFILF